MPDQFVVLLLGPVRSGKTAFLKHIVKNVPRGRTTTCDVYNVQDKSLSPKPLLIIDTPGFSNVPRENLAVLRKIAETIAALPRDSQWRVSGVIYFHRITDVRLTGPVRDIIKITEKICGRDFYPNVAVVTTMWNRIAKEEIWTHRQLHESFLQRLRHFGFSDTFFRLTVPDDSKRHFKRLLSHPLREPDVVLQLQTEVQKRGAGMTSVRKTEAGKEIERSMDKARCTIL